MAPLGGRGGRNSARREDDYQYVALRTALEDKVGHAVNIFGVVTLADLPNHTKGTDKLGTMMIADPSCHEPGLQVNVFAPSFEALPRVRRAGDIIRFHRVKIGRYLGNPGGIVGVCSAAAKSSFVLLSGESSGGANDAAYEPYQVSSERYSPLTSAEQRLVEGLRRWGAEQQFDLASDPYLLLLKSAESQRDGDLCCRILHVALEDRCAAPPPAAAASSTADAAAAGAPAADSSAPRTSASSDASLQQQQQEPHERQAGLHFSSTAACIRTESGGGGEQRGGWEAARGVGGEGGIGGGAPGASFVSDAASSRPIRIVLHVWDGTDLPPLPHKLHAGSSRASSLHASAPLPLSALRDAPPLGSILRVFCQVALPDRLMAAAQEAVQQRGWARLRNVRFEKDEERGEWRAELGSESRFSLLPERTKQVEERKRFFQSRMASSEPSVRFQIPPEQLRTRLTVTNYDSVPCSTLREILSDSTVTNKYRCLVRIVDVLPSHPANFCFKMTQSQLGQKRRGSLVFVEFPSLVWRTLVWASVSFGNG